nr:hypothetical protein CFP56_14337 [Quercus suber]
MATRYSKDKYACIRNLKNEPLAKLTSDSKKRKFGDEKVDAASSSTVNVALPSPSPSLEVTAVTTPITRLKGKSKIRQSVWDNLATTLGRAHNVITNDELKSLLSIPSHELVSQHILKLVQYFKGFELLRRWAMKHHNATVNFSNLDFKKIDTEILEDESKEPEKDTSKETEMDEFGVPEKDKETDGEFPTPPS